MKFTLLKYTIPYSDKFTELCNHPHYLVSDFLSGFFWLHLLACGISVPQPGIEPRPQKWKARILTTRQPRNSHISFSLPSKETYMVKTSKMAVLLLSVHPLPDQCLLHHSNCGPSYLLAPGPNWWLFLAKGQWGVCPLLVSLVTNEPNSPVTGNLPFPSGVKVVPRSSTADFLQHTVGHRFRTLFQTCELPHP